MDTSDGVKRGAGLGARTGLAAALPLHTALPAEPLRACISHYWLCLYNGDAHCAIVPDGAVDIVWPLGATDDALADGAGQHIGRNTSHPNKQAHVPPQALVFGASRTRTLWPLLRGCHYLGIRFRPGQARHFLDVPASELTDAVHAADAALLPSLRGLCQAGGDFVSSIAATVASAIATGDASGGIGRAAIAPLWAQLDALLLAHVRRCPLRPTRMDELIRHMQATPTAEHSWRVAPLVDVYGKSRRQFERHFLDAVGLSPKRFADVLRFQRALALLAQAHWPLAQIAAELGYADQSHFSRAFARFYGAPPARARQDAAFVQDVQHFTAQNASLLSH
ncbi:MAG: helix-turn-helix transcriptional regulator [Brachymonas sp.]|nr:helix-turn-helix transcriptional regulator [Brachymonas sp.]